MITAPPAPSFPALVDLASASFGAHVLGCSNEFFAEAANLLTPTPAIFEPDRYTERGKWMDGWESRRRRSVGEDWCVIQLGVRGQLRALNLDTSHFLGNHAPLARVDACHCPDARSLDALPGPDADQWFPVLEQSALAPGSHNLFTITEARPITHLRLTITPDGGVARLRAMGRVIPSWDRQPDQAVHPDLAGGDVDLAALRNGGRALACSDMFFAPMNNLIAPGRSTYMGGGWETRRKRGPGHDWILLELGAPGSLRLIEVDTGHFHGNHAQRCSLWGVHAPGARLADLLGQDRSHGGWHEVLPPSSIAADRWQRIFAEHPLGPDRREFISELEARGPFTHVRLETFPDGGVARLRTYGQPEKPDQPDEGEGAAS
ncbi:allantoicase [Enhygromyxa salina]|uniref:Probable allantoicase n=1 Tax=Enhygromyxa salina TaxID=215803 RepID=A0A2S9YKH4_9BACT|nr:allantoicase [Enhygromyxa salina]PRQ05610.1 allantoicase [Enhygromyxa salina]